MSGHLDLGTLTTVVVPTMGRPSLAVLLDSLDRSARDADLRLGVVLVDDSRGPGLHGHGWSHLDVRTLSGDGRGPAHARNVGWRAARTPWVSFLDDDVVPDTGWLQALGQDLAGAGPHVGASQANLRVPLPTDRRPTDWERNTAGLETAQWITADMSVRRHVLVSVGGFDERFPRAYREDADLGLRISTRWEISRGSRWVTHPARPVDDWVSLRVQAGNADDVLMRRLHGRHWRRRAGVPKGRKSRHLAITGAALASITSLVSGHPRLAAGLAAGWAAGTCELALARIMPGPRDPDEVRRMLVTSVAIPFAAVWHTAKGILRHPRPGPWRSTPDLVLFDRDGTLVEDVPYNGDPGEVRPVPGAREALDRLRAAGLRVGLVTNQSGVARGFITAGDVAAVNARLAEELGPFDTVQACLHGPSDGCACRKPAPGLVKQACAELDVDPGQCVVVGDIGSDVRAAEAAGAHGLLVPNEVTLREEVLEAPLVAPDLATATDLILTGRW